MPPPAWIRADGIQVARSTRSPFKGMVKAKFVGATQSKVMDWDDELGDDVEYKEGERSQR